MRQPSQAGGGQAPKAGQQAQSPPGAVQGILLYTAELTWDGRKGMEGEYVLGGHQPHGKRNPRHFQSTPRRIVTAESGLTPARAFLNRRQARFTQRYLAGLRGRQGPAEILTRQGSQPTERPRKATWRDDRGRSGVGSEPSQGEGAHPLALDGK